LYGRLSEKNKTKKPCPSPHCTFWCGFNAKCRTLQTDTSVFGSTFQYKHVQLSPCHCADLNISIFNAEKSECKGQMLLPVDQSDIVAMSSKLPLNLRESCSLSQSIFFFRAQPEKQSGTTVNHFQFETRLLTQFSLALITPEKRETSFSLLNSSGVHRSGLTTDNK